jgi:hypothetical protein
VHRGINLSDLEVAVVGGARAFWAARRTRIQLSSIEAYFVAPWRLRYGLQRNFAISRPNLPAYDLARHPRYGRLPRSAGEPKVWSADELTVREAVTLLGNRIAEALEARTEYALVKVAVACADAVLMARGQYVYTYHARAARFKAEICGISATLRKVALQGYSAKLANVPFECSSDDLRTAVIDAFSDLTGQPIEGLDRTARCFRYAWACDAERCGWGMAHKLANRIIAASRAIRHLGAFQTIRLLCESSEPQPVIYATVVHTFLASRGADRRSVSTTHTIPERLTDSPEKVVQVWRAFCR